MKPKDVLLLENVRFYPEEELNDREFAKKLAAPFDIFVNDAFGTAHRAHASTVGVAQFLPAYPGCLMTVSYTHLDVYKRQLVPRPALSLTFRRIYSSES